MRARRRVPRVLSFTPCLQSEYVYLYMNILSMYLLDDLGRALDEDVGVLALLRGAHDPIGECLATPGVREPLEEQHRQARRLEHQVLGSQKRHIGSD